MASVFYGQAIPTANDVEGIAKYLDINVEGLSTELKRSGFIHRGDLGPMPPKDPVIYRLYEVIRTAFITPTWQLDLLDLAMTAC